MPPSEDTVHISRIYHFNAGHRLFRADWSDEKNWEFFGKCSYADGHGHNYTLEVTAVGVPDPDTGWAAPIVELDRAVDQEVMERLDHHNLNEQLPSRYGPAPTTEVLILEVWDALVARIGARFQLHRLRIQETARNTFEYFGPNVSFDGSFGEPPSR